jgi:hypothetical protein
MSYLLQFPPSTLPDKILGPPFVVFGIKSVSVVDKLPARIPLNAVLHFIPKLAQYVLPAPENLPPDVAQDVLRTPRVGIDIRLDIGAGSLQHIIFKVPQSAGEAVPKHLFQHPPPIIMSISIHKTWLLLELPPAGLDGLMIHLQTLIMTGPAVTFEEIKELFNHFPHDSDMLRVTAINFVKAHIDLHYSFVGFTEIRRWYTATKDRYKVFRAAEEQFPEFGKTIFSRDYISQVLTRWHQRAQGTWKSGRGKRRRRRALFFWRTSRRGWRSWRRRQQRRSRERGRGVLKGLRPIERPIRPSARAPSRCLRRSGRQRHFRSPPTIPPSHPERPRAARRHSSLTMIE